MTDFNRDERTPIESYTFTYTEQEMKSLRNELDKKSVVRMIILSVLWTMVFIHSIFANTGSQMSGFIFAILIFIATAWVVRFKRRKYLAEHSDKRVTQSEYLYEFFDDCLRLTVYRSGRFVSCTYTELCDITQYWNTKEFHAFTANNFLYMVKKSALSETSRVPELVCRSNVKKKTEAFDIQNGEKKIPEELKSLDRLAFAFFITSFVLPFVIIILVSILPVSFDLGNKLLGVGFLLCFLVAVASVISGIILRAKGINRVRNIISGVIMAIIFFAFACFGLFMV